jgi:hypothetical protein
LVQWGSLSKADSTVMMHARQEAGRWAMLDVGADAQLASDALYVGEPQVGRDGKPYTSDDQLAPGNSIPFRENIVKKSTTGDAGWAFIARSPSDRLTLLRDSAFPAALFGLTHGHDEATLRTLPAVRSLIYRADDVKVEADVWLTWTKGLY